MDNRPAIRPYRPGDEAGIVALHAHCFAAGLDLETWRWRYEQNPAGLPAIVVAEDAGRIVGHLAFLPRCYQAGPASLKGGLYADMAVHPDYRGGEPAERLSRRLLDAAYPHARALSFDFTCGTPNVRSQGLARRSSLASSLIANFQLSRVLNPLHLLGRAAGPRLRAAGRLGRGAAPPCVQTAVDARLDALWQAAAPGYTLLGARDAATVRWRFLDAPPQAGHYDLYLCESGPEVAGYVVVRLRDEPPARVGYLVDLLARRDDAATVDHLARTALRACRAAGADVVRTWMPGSFPAHAVLRRLGFRPRPTELAWLVYPLAAGADHNLLLNGDNWYLTLGDSDGV